MGSTEAKKQSGLCCPDWVFASNSNVHIAKDRAWFTEYTAFKTDLRDAYGMMEKPIPVLGIGTVELVTKRSPNQTGSGSRAVLHLKNVLHAPSFICNILGTPLFDEYEVTTGGEANPASSGSIKDSEGRRVAPCGAPYGPPLGPTNFEKDVHYMINALWSASERKRWHDYQATANPALENSQYTAEEKAWLKKNFKSEFSFLCMHGLKIYKDEDREEGRQIVRVMMKADEGNEYDEDQPRKQPRM